MKKRRKKVKMGKIMDGGKSVKKASRGFNGIRILRFLVCVLPVCLVFAYHPVISLGSGSSMNFELSLPLIWLVVFDVLAVVMMIKKGKMKVVLHGWAWLLLPVFTTLSLIWSHDKMRGLLTVGILWLIYVAGFAVFSLRREIFDKKMWRKFFMVLFGSAVVACVWCFLQCVLDLAGIARECSLLCPGCVYEVFGFPHPNGFAAEPQFMGNLLIAPSVAALWFLMSGNMFSRKLMAGLFFLFVVTLFLTMSRGAIYAFAVAIAVFTVAWIVKTKKWKILLVWPVVAVAFLATLNVQGLMAELSRTDDTYISGVNKVINQLTLGVIDLGGSQEKKGREVSESAEVMSENSEIVNLEGETLGENDVLEGSEREEAIFDGYVEVSTTSRVDAWRGALEIWSSNAKTAMIGVGFGGAPRARFEYGKYDTAKEIINNEYINVLLELGVVGVGLVILTAWMIAKVAFRLNNKEMIFALLVAYGVSMMFFSGLPNVLHIYLLTPVLMIYGLKKSLI